MPAPRVARPRSCEVCLPEKFDAAPTARYPRGMQQAKRAYTLSTDAVLASLDVDPARGLSAQDASARLERVGRNALQRVALASLWALIFRQFRSAVVLLLAVAAGLSLIFGDLPEAVAILAVIVINAAIGFSTELSAVRSMEALYRLGGATTRVRRDGALGEIDAEELVPGDIVEVEGGDVLSADLRLVSADKLACDESALTGESAPVSKQIEPVAEDAPLAERTCMAYKGTSVTRGHGMGVVVGTGMQTELGTVTQLVAEAEDERTPLEKRIDELGKNLVWVILIVVVLIGGLGILRGKDPWAMVQTAIALAVASIPEGLPIVATVALSRGLLRMARRNALVRRLASVETLGSTSVICSDKTGTLTENRMTVTLIEGEAGRAERQEDGDWAVDEAAGEWLQDAMKVAVLCNNASLARDGGGEWKITGDPLEGALLLAAVENGQNPEKLREQWPKLREDPFESEAKMMATFHGGGSAPEGQVYVAVKGAPEAVLQKCSELVVASGAQPISEQGRERWIRRNHEIAQGGLRMLALAMKRAPDQNVDPYEGLRFLCLIGMVDPAREDVRASIDSCRDAGIRVIMVTGDQAPTALHVARAVGIAGADNERVVLGKELRRLEALSAGETESMRSVNVFARVSPQQKLDLIALHQQAGQIVAMTGDGINDAPALKKADIGVAMGQRGTQVAREVADVVLKDDAFGTIVVAIQQGRVIFGNIRRFVVYLLSCNIAEILVILLASLLNTPLPILPLQILFLNLVTDVFPALALGMGEGEPGVMKHRPRPKGDPLLPVRLWWAIGWYGAYIAAATLGAFFVAQEALGLPPVEVVTVSFMTLACAQLLLVFNMRNLNAGFFLNDVTRNRYVWAALALCAGLLAIAVYVPVMQEVLSTGPLRVMDWLVVLAFSAVPVLIDTAVRRVQRVRQPKP